MERKEILLAGAGGQGILFLGNILSVAVVQKGKKVVTTPSYGAAVRGGNVECGVIVSDQEIHDPVVDDADVVVALNEASLKKFGPKVKEGGLLICKASEETETIVNTFNKRFHLISVPLGDLGADRYHNMVAMGVYLQVDPDLSVDLVREALIEEMEKRGRESLVEENLKAIQAGSEWYLSEEKKQREAR